MAEAETLDGLETNRANQLVVLPRLQTTRDPNIFAIGDCASPWVAGKTVPPRAQAARQQASHLARQLKRLLAERKVKPWRYRDFGCLVSLGDYSSRAQKSDMSLSKPINVVQPAEDRFHNDLSA
jgi:NADH dehydrogenase